MDIWATIDNQVTAMQSFYDGIDKTRKRLNLTPYEMKDPLTKQKMDDVVIVTENRSSSHMKRIIAGLIASKWQSVVEGELSQRESNKIEQFNDASFQQADEYLMEEYGLPGLDVWLVNHACHTGLLGVEWLVDVVEGEYRVHCRPCDMRWTPFAHKKWVAPILFMSKADLLEELDKLEQRAKDGDGEFKKLVESKDTDNEVRIFWTPKENYVLVNKKEVYQQANTFKVLPFVVVWVPSGYYFRDKGYLANESPSLMAINEGMYEQLSRQLSIDATLGSNVLNPPMEYETKNPQGGKSRSRPKQGEDLEVPEGERHVPVPTPDINRAELVSRDQINGLIEAANPLAPRSYTTPPSAIEVTTEVELLDQLQNPQIIALQAFKSQLATLNIKQVLLLSEKGKSILVGRKGKRANVSAADLKDPKEYAINYNLMKQNKRLAIVNEARALAMWGRAPIKYILRDVLAVEDPDGWQREMELEKAKAMNPAIGLAEMAVRYAEEAEDMEGDDKELKNWQSRLLVHEYVQLMRQRMNPLLPGETQNLREASEETGNANGLVSLLGQNQLAGGR